jgi:uncharacterized protein (DUF2141 family)
MPRRDDDRTPGASLLGMGRAARLRFSSRRAQHAAAVVLLLTAVLARAVPTRDISATTAPPERSARVAGKVTWDGHDLQNAILYLYRDPTLKSVHSASPLLSGGGSFEIRVEPGTYYVAAVEDRNRSGALDPGDALGIYGIRSWGDISEHKLRVEVGAGQRASNVNISISALRVNRDGRHQMVAVGDARAYELAAPKAPRTGVLRGSVAGAGVAQASSAKPTYVYASTDLSWQRLIAGARVANDGTFELHAPAGRSYVAAVVDENGSNTFDAGDAFGFFTRESADADPDARKLPVPVALEVGEIREGGVIKLAGRRDAQGGLTSLDAVVTTPGERPTRTVQGQVDWPGHGPTRATVEFYRDASLLSAIATVVTSPTGEFTAQLPEGQYYIVVNADADANGYVSPGDGVGGHGTSDITSFPPRPYTVAEDGDELVITVSGSFTADGAMAPVEIEGDAPTASDEYDVASGLMGRILWDGHAAKEAWLLISSERDFADASMVSVVLDGFGNFVMSLEPGAYYVMAIVDSGGDEQVGPGDGVAIYGARVEQMSGDVEPSRVLVWQDRVTPYVHLSVSAVYTDAGKRYAALDDGSRATIRRSFGEPNDRYQWTRGGRLVEEWRYWAEGVAFTFAANGPGWTKIGNETFTPKREALERMRPDDLGAAQALVAQSTVDAAVYFETEGAVWAFTPDGAQRPVTLGSDPRPMPGGLAYRDADGALMALDGVSGAAMPAMPVEVGASDLAFSDDDSVMAYVREGKLLVRHRSGGERVAPTEGMQGVSDPSWGLGGRVLAFSAGASTSSGMDIYAYDASQNHVEPLVEDAGDDIEPVWSPISRRTLAYTKVVDDIGQLWVTRFSETGEASSTQLTEYGGSGPQWLPDGSGLVYEADGQIWTVDVASQLARPLLVNGEPVIGNRPVVLPLQP